VSRYGQLIAVHTAATGALERTFSAPQSMSAIGFSSDGRILVAGTEKGALALWDAGTGASRGELQLGEGPVVALAPSPDGGHVAAGVAHGEVALVRLDPPAIALRYTPLHAGGQTCALSPEGAAECFGADADAALVCRVAGRTQAMDRCAGRKVTGLAPR
jgi:hypothetical protein